MSNGSTLEYEIDSMVNSILSLTNVFLLISSVLTILILILIYKVKKRDYKEELQIVKQNNIYYVSGWVDSQNSYGAMVRTNIKNFKIKDENGILMIKSNAKVMASNSFIKLFAANWVFSLIVTVITFVIIYAIISSL